MKKPLSVKKSVPNDMNLVKLVEEFSTGDKAREELERLRWPEGVCCPRCQSKKVSAIKGRPQYNCNACDYQFSVTSGTIFNDSHLPLWKWFLATYLMTESKKGMSACQMQRQLSVTYRTAWFLCHRIRAAMKEVNPAPLTGTVEVDETYVGGKVRGRGRGYRGNKVAVIGALQRKGPVRMETLKWVDKQQLHAFIHKATAPDTEKIYTDEHPGYKGIADHDTMHGSVNHSQEEWVHGDIHTNGIESVWSLLKRSVVGTYHKVSVKHLDAYLGELEHRFNNRQNKFLFRDTLLKLVEAEKLTYKKLTKAA
jgi:transposase-like protein